MLTSLRALNIGSPGIPTTAPEPAPGELLPCNEDSWDNGQIGINQPLFVDCISAESPLGSFANLCQAAHTLSKVLHHREVKENAANRHILLEDAHQLNRALTALYAYIRQRCSEIDLSVLNSHFVALALCCSARFTLYEMYACNEHYSTTTDVHVAEQISMQQISLAGINEIVKDAQFLAEKIIILISSEDNGDSPRISPLFVHCFYLGLSECSWLFREDDSSARAIQIKSLRTAIVASGNQWKISGTSSLISSSYFDCS